MSLIKCPKCGEMFSDSYKTCPFCQEDEEFYGDKKPKNPGRHLQRNKAPSIVGPAMVVVVILLVGFLVYFFLGDQIAGVLNNPNHEQIEETVPPVDPEKNPETEDGAGTEPPLVALTLDQTTLSLEEGETAALTASGAESYTWNSSDTSVITVDEAGNVKAVSAGTATVTAAAEGAASAACEITVTEKPKPVRKLKLGSRWLNGDVGIGKPGDSTQLYLKDENGDIVEDVSATWSSADTSVATVDANGVVTAVGGDKTTITAEVDGQKMTCVVRVN